MGSRLFSKLAIGLVIFAGILAIANAQTDPFDFGEPGYRTWTDSTGKFTTEAKFIDAKGDTAYLLKTNGEKIGGIPIARLSAVDKQYVGTQQSDSVVVGKIIGVSDGDSLTILDDSRTQFKIRLDGIDAPESGQDFGTQSKKALSDKVFQKTVQVEWKKKDRYGRTLGNVICDGRWINKDLVDEGWAWHFKQYNNSAILAQSEVNARTAKVGLWADGQPIAPWDFRKTPATPRAPPITATDPDIFFAPSNPRREVDQLVASPVSQTVYVTKTGAKYHAEGCRYLSKSSTPISLDEADSSYSPCSVCRPPTLEDKENGHDHSETAYAPRSNTPSTSPEPVSRNPHGENVTGYTPTGLPIFTGPRGGRYHYSKSGKKVYEKKK